jgi:hypothetical protein
MTKSPRRPRDWGSELPDDPPPIDTPISTASGFDLSRDMDAQVKARADAPDPVLREPLTTPFRRLHAIHYGAGAAGMLTLLNLVAMLDANRRPADVLIGSDLRTFLIAQLVAAALAAGLALLIVWRRSLWACRIVMVWSVVELAFPIFRYLYGHVIVGRAWGIAFSAAAFAYVGLRGAWAEQDAEAKDRDKAAADPKRGF